MSELVICLLQDADEKPVSELIRRNMESYQESGTVLAATFRRLENLCATYSSDGAAYFTAKDARTGACIGGAGIGPLHGLPPSEGVGEIRDVVVDRNHRSRGIATRLLQQCMQEATKQSYKSLYLEVTPQMDVARKLFHRFGFKPVQDMNQEGETQQQMPCYFLLETDEQQAG